MSRRVFVALIILLISPNALADDLSEITLSVDTTWIDSRDDQPFFSQNDFGLGLKGGSERLFGAAELDAKLRTKRGAIDRLDWELKQAEAQALWSGWAFGGGRMALRHQSLSLHEAAKDWLGTSPRGDGARLSKSLNDSFSRAEIYFLAPEGVGAGASWCSSPLCFWTMVSWQSQKIVFIPVAIPSANVDWDPRQTEEWFMELALSVKGPSLRATGAFQGSQMGPFRTVSGDRVGDRDHTLPDSQADYRAVAQIDGLFHAENEFQVWGSCAVGGRAAPRLYWGQEDADFLRQGSGGRLFVSPALLLVDGNQKWELGLQWAHAKDPSEIWFGRRDSSGQRTLSKERIGLWSSFEAQF